MPDGVVDANFYRSASRVSDDVAPVEVIQLNPAVSPASALREACLCWPDLITNPPNWRVVGVHVARAEVAARHEAYMRATGRGGPARVRGDVKLLYSAGVTLKTPVPNEP